MKNLSVSGDQKWEEFCARRLNDLGVLAETVEESFLRTDTNHPVFCGCVDWHSSVHGAYALLTAARLLKHPRWSAVVDEGFRSDGLQAEWISLRRGDLDHELPYGYAWFLRLAQEREQGWGKKDLLPLASEIALRLEHWLISLTDDEVVHHVQRREYGNLSWALLNLWSWSKGRQNARQLDQLSHFTRDRLLPLDRECAPDLDGLLDEFFPAALQRCRSILTILSPEESMKWLESHPYKWKDLSPLKICPTTHAAGLNFSRSWGLWTLYQHTRDPAYRELYVDHLMTQMGLPEYWESDYRKHAHWVPQFGIYALALSFETEADSA